MTMSEEKKSVFTYKDKADCGVVVIFANGHEITELSYEDSTAEDIFNWFVGVYSKTNLSLSYTGYLEWKSPDTVPEVKEAAERLFWLAVEYKRVTPHPDSKQTETFTFLAFYQNRPIELDDDGEPTNDDYLVNTDGEPMESIGWVTDKQHDEFDNYYMPIEFSDHYKLLGWAEYTPPKFTGVPISSPDLFALHVSGSDSLLACESLEFAEKKNKELNDFFATMPKSELHPVMDSKVIEWPYCAKSHKQEVLNVDWSDIH